MAIPETPTVATPPTPRQRRTPMQAWTRFAQVMSILLILASFAFGLFVSLGGYGGLIGGSWTWMEAAFYFPLLLLIPLIVSWVVYKKHKVLALVLSLVTFVMLACPAAFIAIFFSVNPG